MFAGPGVSQRATLWLPALIAATVAGCGSSAPDNAEVRAAVAAGRAEEVTIQGPVLAVLADSTGRSGDHERFTVDVGDQVIVEIDHNLTLAAAVPVHAGSVVTVHGEFAPDPGHPVIHYTHHSTNSHHEGGWIELDGHRYQ